MAKPEENNPNDNNNNNKKNNNNEKNNENNIINDNLKKIKDINQKLNNNIENIDLDNIFTELSNILYSKNDLIIFSEISDYYIEIIITLKNYFLKNPNSETILLFLEKNLFLSLFHFHFKILFSGYSLLNFLLLVTDEDYHIELLNNILKIFEKMSKIKFSYICKNIIYNLSVLLNIFLNNKETTKKTKKVFYDYLIKNSYNYNLLYLIIISNNSDLINYNKIFDIEEIYKLIEKFKMILSNLINDNNDNLDIIKISFYCKILSNLILKTSYKTYKYDKLIKDQIPLGNKIINYILNKKDNINNLENEIIYNILIYCIKLDSFNNNNLILILKYLQNNLNKNLSYLSSTYLIINELVNSVINDDNEIKKTNICKIIIQFIENILNIFEDKINDIYLNIYIYKLKECINILNKDFKYDEEKYINTKNFFNKNDNSNILINYDISNFNINLKYYNNSINQNEIKFSINKNDIIDCLNKFEEFKNRMKKIYNIENEYINIENKINEFKSYLLNNENNIENNKITKNYVENFFLETSIGMFNEIFSSNF